MPEVNSAERFKMVKTCQNNTKLSFNIHIGIESMYTYLYIYTHIYTELYRDVVSYVSCLSVWFHGSWPFWNLDLLQPQQKLGAT